MSDECINREDAIKEILAIPPGNWSSKRYAEAVRNVPSVNVFPVKRGQWFEGKNGRFFCSECGTDAYLKMEQGLFSMAFVQAKTLYCPNCGARMLSDDEIADGIGQTFSPD